MKNVFLVLFISLTCRLCSSVIQVTRGGSNDGDTIVGINNCTEYYGDKILSPATCKCQDSSGNKGTFFTSCLYENELSSTTGCSCSLNGKSPGYLNTASDLLNKDITDNGQVVQAGVNCTKLHLSSVDVWHESNTWQTFQHSLIEVDTVSGSNADRSDTFQLIWTLTPDQNVWKDFKGQILRLTTVCTHVNNNLVQQRQNCMLLKLSGSRVYTTPESPDFPYTTPQTTTTTTTITTTTPSTTKTSTATTTLSTATTTLLTVTTIETITTTQNLTSNNETSPNTTMVEVKEDEDKHIDIIAGLVAGGVVLLLLIVFLIVACRKKNACNGMFKREVIETNNFVGKPDTIAQQSIHHLNIPRHRASSKHHDEDDYLEPLDNNKPKEMCIQVKSDEFPRNDTTIIANQNTSGMKLPIKQKPSVPIIRFTQNDKEEPHPHPPPPLRTQKPTPKPRAPSTLSYDNPLTKTIQKIDEKLAPTFHNDRRKISSQPLVQLDQLKQDSTLSSTDIGNGSNNPKGLVRQSSNTSLTSEHSSWGDEFDDDHDVIDTSLSRDSDPHPYFEYSDDEREPVDENKNTPEHGHNSCTHASASPAPPNLAGNLEVPSTRTSSQSDYQKLKSVKRHLAEAGIYATLTQEF